MSRTFFSLSSSVGSLSSTKSDMFRKSLRLYLVIVIVGFSLAALEGEEDKDLVYIRRRQQTRCNETACIIKYFDEAETPFYFVSECKAEKIKAITFVEPVKMTLLPGDIFKDVRNLKILTVNNSGLEQVNGTFKDATYLEEIYLANNSLGEVGDRFFEGAARLSTINLRGNKIFYIHAAALKTLRALRVLNLADNLIENLDKNVFADNARLHSVDLSGNKLSTLDQKIFYQSQDLEWLYLQNNQLTSLNVHFPTNQLYWLNVDGNQLRELILKAETKLQNRLTYITANRNNLGKIRISTEFNVKNLYVESNNHVDLFDLKSLTSLSDLRLGNNRLSHVTSIVFGNLKNLEILYMHSTNFSVLRSDLFVAQPKLKILHIGYNHISLVDLRFLKSLKALEQLYLDGNELSDLNLSDLKEWLPNLKKIELRANRWTCRNLKAIISYIRAFEVELISKEVENTDDDKTPNVEGIRCEEDANLQDLKCQLKEMERRLNAMEEAYNENLKIMKESDCCNLAAAKELGNREVTCKAEIF